MAMSAMALSPTRDDSNLVLEIEEVLQLAVVVGAMDGVGESLECLTVAVEPRATMQYSNHTEWVFRWH